MASLSDRFLAFGLAEDVDAGVQRSDADCVCAGRYSVLVVHGCHDVFDYCGAVVVEYFGCTQALQVFVVLGRGGGNDLVTGRDCELNGIASMRMSVELRGLKKRIDSTQHLYYLPR